MTRAPFALALALAGACLLAACDTKPKQPVLGPVARPSTRPAPKYADIVAGMNERAALLKRVWARSVTSFSWTDHENNARNEQGEGFFQLIQPTSLALDIGKVGEVIVWAGCDAKRYWLIRRNDEKTAVVGRHNGPGVDRLAEEGFPATPLDLIALSGVTPLDPNAKPLALGWTSDNWWLLEIGTKAQSVRMEIDPRNAEPRKITFLRNAVPLIESELTNYAPVEVAERSLWAKMATRIAVTDLFTQSRLTIGLEGMSDGIRGRSKGNERMKPVTFDFETLCERLGVTSIEDLDAPSVPAPRPAAPASTAPSPSPASVVPPAAKPELKESAPPQGAKSPVGKIPGATGAPRSR